MNQFKIHTGIVLGLFLFVAQIGHAQTIAGYTSGGSSASTFDTYQEQLSGLTVSEVIHIQIQGIQSTTNIPNWSIKVRALGNYINQSDPSASVAPHHTSLQFNDVNKNPMEPANQNPIALGTSAVTLVSGAPPLTPQSTGWYLVYHFDFIIHGGNHLLVANGSYRASLEFLLYDGNNNLIGTGTINNVGFQIQSNINNGSSISLQNSADIITFQFDDVGDYYSGLSVNKAMGFKVTAYNPYDIIIKANTPNLTSTTTNHTIPIQLFKLEVTQTEKNLPYLDLLPSTSLSTSDQVYIENPLTNYMYQEVQYNLRYFVPSSSAADVFGYAGTYTTNLFFIFVPQ